MTTNFNELPEFTNEFRHYLRKYRTLDGDFLNFKKIILSIPCGVGKHFNIITIYSDIKVIKARLFCRTLKKSSLRIIYAYHKNKESFDFIEIYFKGEKVNENRERIKDYLKNLGK